jgi:amino acid transporter
MSNAGTRGSRYLLFESSLPEHVMNPHWNQWIAFGWLFFFVIFVGLDAAAWISGDRRVPTFSRVVTHLLPWWVVLPLCCILFVHFLLIYAERASAHA